MLYERVTTTGARSSHPNMTSPHALPDYGCRSSLTTIPTMCEPSPRKLAEFLLAAMKPMVRRDGLLCFRLRQTARGLIQEGVSHRYTLIALLGIKRAQSAG